MSRGADDTHRAEPPRTSAPRPHVLPSPSAPLSPPVPLSRLTSPRAPSAPCGRQAPLAFSPTSLLSPGPTPGSGAPSGRTPRWGRAWRVGEGSGSGPSPSPGPDTARPPAPPPPAAPSPAARVGLSYSGHGPARPRAAPGAPRSRRGATPRRSALHCAAGPGRSRAESAVAPGPVMTLQSFQPLHFLPGIPKYKGWRKRSGVKTVFAQRPAPSPGLGLHRPSEKRRFPGVLLVTRGCR